MSILLVGQKISEYFIWDVSHNMSVTLMAATLKVKIVDANLKANGELFVSVHLKSQGIVNALKTDTIGNTNHPTWNKEFDFTCENIQTDAIIISVIEREIIGDIQVCSKEITTSDFIRFDNRKYSFDLTKKKKRSGSINIEVNASKSENAASEIEAKQKEEEKPKKVILKVKVVDAQKLRKTGKNTVAYPSLTLKLKSQDIEMTEETEVAEGTRDPVWNEDFQFVVDFPESDFLVINMQDNSESGGTLCDEIMIPVNSFVIGAPPEMVSERLFWRRKTAGMLRLEIQAVFE
ncbi:hypothetical protein TRFO_12182 [Tritrichomonas foetus]|uniref:C2 domain-containing protein n=1 Tax=Tritrichomonas foetus TaxID=1144522 RepID=A0A1J4J5Q4_9EUKA|nr:hypothetical protein TRFO_12182 [Tritrichomonas foetus]|eukprot:OHS92987.1 hypothetical protein TRFO_12182 [Tritrichomonas foetus]